MKRKYLNLLLLLIPLLLSIGFSAWIIIYTFDFTPTYQSNEVAKLFDYSYTYTYDGTEHRPEPHTKPSGNVTFSYQYKYTDEDQFHSGAPLNGGEYDVLITASGDLVGSCQVKVTIEKLKIKAKPITVTYDEMKTKSTWGNFADEIYGRLEYTDSSGNALPNGIKPTINSAIEMTNGDSNCYYLDNNNDAVIGSTYILRLDLYGTSSENYSLYDYETFYDKGSNVYNSSGSTIVKYQTVKTSTGFSTIEEALSKGGDITLCGDSSSTVFTAFTNIKYYSTEKQYDLKSGSTLWITHNGSNTPYTIGSESNVVYSVLYIPTEVTLTVNGTINICATISDTVHAVTTRGVLFNNGNMIITSTGVLNSYGYLKGAGNIDAQSGSNIVDIMRFYNHGGSGGMLLSMNNAKIFPLSCYSLHNISCTIKLDANATFSVFYNIDMSIVTLSSNLTLIGTGGLFDLTNGYLIKGVEDTTSSFYSNKSNLKSHYNTSNQDVTQREVIQIYGKFTDNKVSITETYMGKKVGITTGPDYAMPIGFMNIQLKNDNKGNVGIGEFSSNSYKVYPGAKLTIDEGASLTINSGINIIFYDETFDDAAIIAADGEGNSYSKKMSYTAQHSAWYSSGRSDIGAQLVVNGSLISKGNLGGFIQTTTETGNIQLDNTNASLAKMTKEKYTTNDKFTVALGGTTCETADVSVDATGFIDNVYNKTTFTSAMYISKYDASSNKVYWLIAKDAKSFEITFIYGSGENDKITKTVYVLDPNADGTYTYEITGKEFEPTKDYYTLGYWLYNNSDVTNQVFNVEDTPTISLTAYWVPDNYKIQYIAGYVDSSNNPTILTQENGLVLNEEAVSFTVEDLEKGNISIQTTASYLDKSFKGWYLGDDISSLLGSNAILINSTLTVDDFKKLDPDKFIYDLEKNCYYINLYCLFTDEKEYTINYVTQVNGFTVTSQTVTSNGTLSLPEDANADLKNNPSIKTYVEKWAIDTEGNVTVVNGEAIKNVVSKLENEGITVSNTITIYGKPKDKEYTVTYYNHNNDLIDTHFYYSGQTNKTKEELIRPVEDDFARHTYIFKNWVNKNDSTNSYIANEDITPSGNLELKATYTSIDECKITLTNSNTTTTITCGEISIKNGDYVIYGSTITISITKTSGSNLIVLINDKEFYQGQSSTYTTSIDVTEHMKIEAKGECIPSGTKIMMANGTMKNVEDLKVCDSVLIFNHETGKLESSPILFIEFDGWADYELINLEFSNGVVTRLIYEHGYFNKTLNKYIYINNDNYKDYIGDLFMYYNGHNFEEVVLQDAYVTTEYVGCYSPVTAYHLNFFSDGMLSMPGGIEGLFNIFDYDEELRYDVEKMEIDIDNYGLFNYDVFKDYMPFEVYEMLPAKYMSIAIGKGMITFDDILSYIKKYLVNNEVV